MRARRVGRRLRVLARVLGPRLPTRLQVSRPPHAYLVGRSVADHSPQLVEAGGGHERVNSPARGGKAAQEVGSVKDACSLVRRGGGGSAPPPVSAAAGPAAGSLRRRGLARLAPPRVSRQSRGCSSAGCRPAGERAIAPSALASPSSGAPSAAVQLYTVTSGSPNTCEGVHGAAGVVGGACRWRILRHEQAHSFRHRRLAGSDRQLAVARRPHLRGAPDQLEGRGVHSAADSHVPHGLRKREDRRRGLSLGPGCAAGHSRAGTRSAPPPHASGSQSRQTRQG